VTAVLRSELYRWATIRSSWILMGLFALLGALLGWFSADLWALLAGLGAFAIAVLGTAQHYQHSTVVLLHLGQPHRLTGLAAQAIAAASVAVLLAAVSGTTVLATGKFTQFGSTLAVVPLMAVFGVANATVIRRPAGLLLGYAAWLLFVEALIGGLKKPLPFTTFLDAGTGNRRSLLIFTGWTLLTITIALVAVRRDLTSD